MIKIFHSIYSDFYLLDDGTCDYDDKYIKIKSILKYFRSKNIDYEILSYRRIAYGLKKEIIKTEKKIQIDLIITIGKGGQLLFDFIKNDFSHIECINIDIYRTWNENKIDSFSVPNLDKDIKGKRVIIVEDVVSTGSTLEIVKSILKMASAQISLFLIGIANNYYDETLFGEIPTVINYILNDNISRQRENIDKFWYPPIYSYRHLINHENGMKDFPMIMAQKYFDNDEVVMDVLV